MPKPPVLTVSPPFLIPATSFCFSLQFFPLPSVGFALSIQFILPNDSRRGSRGQTSSETRPRTCTLDLRPKPCDLSYGTQVSPHRRLGNRGASGERGEGHLSACISPPTHTHHGSHQHLHLTLSPHSTGHLGAGIPSPGLHGSPRCGHSFPRSPRVTLVWASSSGHPGAAGQSWSQEHPHRGNQAGTCPPRGSGSVEQRSVALRLAPLEGYHQSRTLLRQM